MLRPRYYTMYYSHTVHFIIYVRRKNATWS